jgi:hypothetical protein
MREFLSDRLNRSFWIDDLQRQIKVKKKALPEIAMYLGSLHNESPSITAMSTLLKKSTF